MNIQPIGLSTKTNFEKNNKQNVAFGNFSTSVTKRDFIRTAIETNELYKIPKKDLKVMVGDFWKNIEQLKETYKDNLFADLHIFKAGPMIWGEAHPTYSRGKLNRFGKGQFALEHEYIIGHGNLFAEKLQKYAKDIEEKYKNRRS